jgi:hypothetical protein
VQRAILRDGEKIVPVKCIEIYKTTQRFEQLFNAGVAIFIVQGDTVVDCFIITQFQISMKKFKTKLSKKF